MRMRKKKNLASRMERVSNILIKKPENIKGNWITDFPGYKEVHIELGCGKGRFTAETAEANPGILFIAIERVPDAMIIAMERVAERALGNVLFVNMDAALLNNVFEEREVGRIYINFCDPWPSAKHAKRRLTSPSFLNIYRQILKHDGDIHFKTDNCELFQYSVEQFEQNGFDLSNITENLHKNGINGVMTDYESKFYAEGKPIFRLEAKPTELSTKAVEGECSSGREDAAL